MPRYFFHIRTEIGLTPDEEGMDLPSLALAHLEAVLSVADLVRDAAREGKRPNAIEVVVVDESGVTVMTVPVMPS